MSGMEQLVGPELAEAYVVPVMNFLRNNIGLVMFLAFFLFQKWKASGPMPEAEGANLAQFSNLKDFQAWLGSEDEGKLCVVDFYATWCPPCRACAKPYGEMSIEHGGEGKAWQFAKIDVDAAREVSQWAKIQSMPTFKLYRGGKEVATFGGFQQGKIQARMAELEAETKKDS
eukprot:TRINITY_DN6629_c0_g1_i1.p1 TRINITY_DN6629_c0_g1~~TRINITY_DN6629_c0_g1_i1.p1  ORF type:complete len:187 (+),score=69.73 TRINITY_DN6629_c0_g1_i1:47-562(+)